MTWLLVRGEAKKLFTKVFRLVRAARNDNINGFFISSYIRFVVYHYMSPYILKKCGFNNSTVYTFYSMYQKYTFFVKLYICGLTYRLSQHPDIRIRSYPFYWWWIPGIPVRHPPLDLWDARGMGSLLGSAAVVGSLLRWVARKTFIAKSPADPSRNTQMMGVAQRGRLKFLKMSFWRII